MRRISEEVAGWFPTRRREPELVLLPVDPHRVHAYWAVEEAAVHAAQAEAGSPYAPLVLRVRPRGETDPGGHDVQMPPFRSSCYVDSLEAARTYDAELGVSTPDGRLIPLLRSNAATLPPNSISARASPEAVDVRMRQRSFPLPPHPPSPGAFDAWPPLSTEAANIPEPGEAATRSVADAAAPAPPPTDRRRLDPAVLGRRVIEAAAEPLPASAVPTSPRSRTDSDVER